MADELDLEPVFVTEMPHDKLSFDVEAFDKLIRSQGMQFVHHRAVGCPVGMQDLHDSRRAHEDHSGCSGGFLYKRVGLVTMAPSSNSASERKGDSGSVDNATFQASVPTQYDDRPTEFPYLTYHDRLYLNEEQIVVPQWEKVSASDTGVDKLRFVPTQVRVLIDSQGQEYSQGHDFELEGGRIAWGQRRPAPGVVYSVWYLYRPYWYVQRLSKEIRISQVQDELTGKRVVARLPQLVVLQREYIFEVNDQDDQAPGSDLRQEAAAKTSVPPMLNPNAPFGR